MSQGKIVVSKVEEARPSEFSWGQVRWLYHGHKAADAELTFGIITLYPGEQYPEHAHANCEELAYVLKGRVRYIVNDQEIVLSPGTLVRAPREALHHAENLEDEKAVVAVVYSAPIRETAVFKKDRPPSPSDNEGGRRTDSDS